MSNREHQPSPAMQPSPTDDNPNNHSIQSGLGIPPANQRGNATSTSFTAVPYNRLNIRKPPPQPPQHAHLDNNSDAAPSKNTTGSATDSAHVSRANCNRTAAIPTTHVSHDNAASNPAGPSILQQSEKAASEYPGDDSSWDSFGPPSSQHQSAAPQANNSSPSSRICSNDAGGDPPNQHSSSVSDGGGSATGGGFPGQAQPHVGEHALLSNNNALVERPGDLLCRCYSGGSKGVSTLGLFYAVQEPRVFSKLPHLKDLSGNEYVEILHQKVAACRDVVFDFRGIGAEYFRNEKEDKKITLNEILGYVNEPRKCPLEQLVEEIIQMVSRNIFRPLPPSTAPLSSLILTDPDDNEPRFESAWPHLQIVYEILLRMIMSNEINPKSTKKYVDHSFVLKEACLAQLLNLFASEDPRERDYLKTIMHRLYGKIMALRAFIRKAIQHIFYRYIHEQDGQPGVSELLEILGSIINGFAQPLKEEHKLFLKRCMIPLHKSRHLIAFHQQLTYCMAQYIEKDEKLIEPIVNGILRYWPVTSTPKEVLFINEIEEILELTPPAEFQKILDPLFKRMALCIQSPHFQVAERVLFLWNNTRIVKLINQHRAQLFPLVIGALYKNSKGHWNATVHGLTYNVCKLLAETDPNLFDRCNDETLKKEEKAEKDRLEKKRFWMALKQQQQQQQQQQKQQQKQQQLELKQQQMQVQQRDHLLLILEQQQQQHDNNEG